MVKKLFFILLALVTLLFPCLSMAAEQYVWDEALLLSSDERYQLENRAAQLSDTYNTDVILLTTEDTEGKETKIFCADYFEAHGFGRNEGQDGVLLCVDMDNRQIMLVTHGATIPYFTDEKEEAVYDAMYNGVRDGYYADAFMDGMAAVETYLKEEPGHGQFTYDRATGEVTGFYYPEEAEQILQSGVAEGYMLKDEATGKYYYYPYGVPAPGLLSKERLKNITPGYVGVSALAAAVAGLLARAGVARGYKRPFEKSSFAMKENFVAAAGLGGDKLMNKFVTTRIIPRVEHNDNSGRGGGGFGGFSGGSGTFSSSSGGSFGGGGGRGF